MALEISGRVLQVLQEQTGTGKNGPWIKQEFVIETADQYPRRICFSTWGDKASQVKNLKPGETVNVSFNAESREFNGKWYTDLRAWKIDQVTAPAQSASSAPSAIADEGLLEPLPPGENEANDLPF